ncbi:MAG: exonuclease [Thaumarchaeota archaeon]|nr:exonuclease [Nitrososphaerota archaeon]
MVSAKVSANNGIQVDYQGKRFALDPTSPARADYTFVSHAHVDHMHTPSRNATVIASEETRELAAARGFDLGDTVESVDGADTLDSGHILGSRALAVGEEVYYTGDASGRERGFLGKCKTRRSRVLIMESTFGSPEYVFPQTAKLVKEVNSLVGEMFHRGRPVVLMGYPLGKAQLLTYYFSTWSPLIVHSGVARMNEIYASHGVPLKVGTVFDPADGTDSLPRGPWVMISPMSSGRSQLMSELRRKHGAVLVAFSGWAAREGYRRSIGADFAFPLSDHCDYPELVRLVQGVSPDVVYTTHGFAAEFAADLRHMGFTARPLAPYQSSLGDFANGD